MDLAAYDGSVMWKKFPTYPLRVSSEEQDKAIELQLRSFARPHMRVFHFCWWCLFISYISWLAITPLLSEVRISLDLSKEDLWTSSILSIPLATILGYLLRDGGRSSILSMLLMINTDHVLS